MNNHEKADWLRRYISEAIVDSGHVPHLKGKFGMLSEWMLTDDEILIAMAYPHKCNHKTPEPGIFTDCKWCEISLFAQAMFDKMAVKIGAPSGMGRDIAIELNAKEEKARGCA